MAIDLLGGLGAGVSFLGDLFEGFGKAQTYKQMSLIDELNAAVSRANAAAIRQSGEMDVRKLTKAKARYAGGQRALYAKAGVRLEGSPIEVMIDSAAEWETDILVAKYNTKVQEIQANLTGQLYDAQSKMAKAKSLGAIGGTLLSTASLFSGMGVKSDPRGTAGGYRAYLRSR